MAGLDETLTHLRQQGEDDAQEWKSENEALRKSSAIKTQRSGVRVVMIAVWMYRAVMNTKVAHAVSQWAVAAVSSRAAYHQTLARGLKLRGMPNRQSTYAL